MNKVSPLTIRPSIDSSNLLIAGLEGQRSLVLILRLYQQHKAVVMKFLALAFTMLVTLVLPVFLTRPLDDKKSECGLPMARHLLPNIQKMYRNSNERFGLGGEWEV